jgi:hypothetical protein
MDPKDFDLVRNIYYNKIKVTNGNFWMYRLHPVTVQLNSRKRWERTKKDLLYKNHKEGPKMVLWESMTVT